MKIYLSNTKSKYEAEHVCRLFFVGAQLADKYPNARQEGDAIVVHESRTRIMCGIRIDGKVHCDTLKKSNDLLCSADVIVLNNAQANSAKGNTAASKADKKVCATEKQPGDNNDDKRRRDYVLCSFIYNTLSRVTGKKMAWGMLTGVRPVRLIHDMRRAGLTDAEIERKMCKGYYVSQQKYALALGIANLQNAVTAPVQKVARPYSLYVSIPFCPTRCNYCSFVSSAVAKSTKLIQPYMHMLEKELVLLSRTAQNNNLSLQSIYIGGGTPTSVSAIQLHSLMSTINNYFDVKSTQEYTVEAGRPDCTTPQKLAVMKELGATRISINPQSMNDEVLSAIGRNHTAKDVCECFLQARQQGHDNINMDLIAGLPKDTQESFSETLNIIKELSPENVTVHTLSLKRASTLTKSGAKGDDVASQFMIEAAHSVFCEANGYSPYYLYRQKNTPGNLENTGYTKDGFAGLYNIYIMEEMHTILSAGAGGSTKLVDSESGRIERIFNHKYPTEYMDEFDELCDRKKGVDEFYAK